MRIALDVRFRVESGASSYIRSIVPVLMEAAPDVDFLYVRYDRQSLTDLPPAPSIDAPMASGLRDLLWTNRDLPRALREHRVDLYHGLKLFGPLQASLPTVHTVHSITRPRGGEFPMSLTQRAIHEYGNTVFRRSCRLIGVSGYVSDFLVDELRIPREKVRTVHLGVPDAFREALARADGPRFSTPGLGDAPYLVCVGNVEYVKNHATVARALSHIRDRVPHHLVIAGRAEKRAGVELRDLIESEGLGDRVHLVGFLEYPALISCMTGAELQVHVSLSEGFSLAVLEGMCVGLPIVGSAVPGVVEAMGGTGVTIQDPLDHRALSDTILRWLDDPEEARTSGERARRRAERLTWETTAEGTVAVYQECLAP